jgi:hypothetical protein
VRAQEFIVENADQAAVDALMKKHGWSMGRTVNGDLAFAWQGNTYVLYGERMRINWPNGQSVSVVWGKKPDWQGRGNEFSFAQAVQKKYLTFDLPVWQALDRGQISDAQAMQQFKAENERQAKEALTQGVAEGSEQINEYRDRLLQYVKSLLPTWPEYVLKDWLVPNKGNFSNLSADALKNGIMEKVQGAGLNPDSKWQLVPNMKFTMDMFDPKTKQLLIGRAGGSSDLGMGIPKDKERHATQAALAQQQGGVRKEPVLLIKTAKGYELLEGWHRTIQHFVKYPDGYTGPAYIAVAQSKQGVAEGLLGEADASAVQFRTASTDNYQSSFTVTAIADGKNVGHFSFFRDPETDDVHNHIVVNSSFLSSSNRFQD